MYMHMYDYNGCVLAPGMLSKTTPVLIHYKIGNW